MSKVGFLTFDKDRRDKTGSARIRAHNLIKYEQNFEEFTAGVKYNVVVFQKFYWHEYAELYQGIKILDICDPDWLGGSKDVNIRRMLNAMDGVVCNTKNMADYIKKITDKPITVIPDRHDMNIFKEKKIHTGDAKSAIWFGYSHNARVLEIYINKLQEMGIRLTIMAEKAVSACRSNRSYKDMETFVKWPDTIRKVNRELIRHDFALLPKRRKYQDQYKSNNKATHARAVGLPVVQYGDELDIMIKADARIDDQEKYFKDTKREYNCKRSIVELNDFIKYLVKINGTRL